MMGPHRVITWIRRIADPQCLEDCYLIYTKFGRFFGYNHFSIEENGRVFVNKWDLFRFIAANLNFLYTFYVGFTLNFSDEFLKYESIVVLTLGNLGSQFAVCLLMVKREESHRVITTLQRVYDQLIKEGLDADFGAIRLVAFVMLFDFLFWTGLSFVVYFLFVEEFDFKVFTVSVLTFSVFAQMLAHFLSYSKNIAHALVSLRTVLEFKLKPDNSDVMELIVKSCILLQTIRKSVQLMNSSVAVLVSFSGSLLRAKPQQRFAFQGSLSIYATIFFITSTAHILIRMLVVENFGNAMMLTRYVFNLVYFAHYILLISYYTSRIEREVSHLSN